MDCSSNLQLPWNLLLFDLNICNLMMSAKTYEKCLNGISFEEHVQKSNFSIKSCIHLLKRAGQNYSFVVQKVCETKTTGI